MLKTIIPFFSQQQTFCIFVFFVSFRNDCYDKESKYRLHLVMTEK